MFSFKDVRVLIKDKQGVIFLSYFISSVRYTLLANECLWLNEIIQPPSPSKADGMSVFLRE